MSSLIGDIPVIGSVLDVLQSIFNPEQAKKDCMIRELMRMGEISSPDEVKGMSVQELKDTLQEAMSEMGRPEPNQT